MNMTLRSQAPLDPRPRDASGRIIISVRRALEWAFAVECASLDFDEIGASAAPALPSFGAEYRIAQQLALGKGHGQGVRVDTSFGRSACHDDADLIATVLRNSVSHFGQAIWVADLARAQAIPQWDLGQPRLQPRGWVSRGCQAGQRGKSEVLEVIDYRARRRGTVKRQVMWTPCRWVPDVSQVASARRAYLDWWGILFAVRSGLKSVHLEKFSLSDAMPPHTPWKKTC